MKNLKFILIVFMALTLLPVSSVQARGSEKHVKNYEQDPTGIAGQKQGEQKQKEKALLLESVQVETLGTDDELDVAPETFKTEQSNQGVKPGRGEGKEILLDLKEGGKDLVHEAQGVGQEVDKGKARKAKFSDEKTGKNKETIDRRSKTANAVQKMLRVAERNEGIGSQVREIARVQNQVQEEADVALGQARGRKNFVKFLIGANNSSLDVAEKKLIEHRKKIKELEVVKNQLEDESDKEILTQQIQVMEQVGSEIEKEITDERQVFSLFGWFSKLFSKRN